MSKSQPFIMPDGRPLGAFLQEDGQRAGADAGRRRGSVKSKKHGKQAAWDRSFRTSAAHAFAGAASSEADRIELEVLTFAMPPTVAGSHMVITNAGSCMIVMHMDAQAAACRCGTASQGFTSWVQAISKEGRDRRRRWLNDKILRDMAGAMTAAGVWDLPSSVTSHVMTSGLCLTQPSRPSPQTSMSGGTADMDSLFKPPPFGGTVPRPSALTAAATPENMPLWDLFRNIGAHMMKIYPATQQRLLMMVRRRSPRRLPAP